MGNMNALATNSTPGGGSYGSFNTVFGTNSSSAASGGLPSSSDTNTPPLLDLSEFPSLTNRGNPTSQSSNNPSAVGSLSGDSAGSTVGVGLPQPSPMPGSKPYVGMVKQPTAEQSEFQMSSEDFPALPGTQQSRDGAEAGGGGTAGKEGGGGDTQTADGRTGDKNGKSGEGGGGCVVNLP